MSTVVGCAVISGITNALGTVRRPALVLDRTGFVLDANFAKTDTHRQSELVLLLAKLAS